jgi:hypothetical protein
LCLSHESTSQLRRYAKSRRSYLHKVCSSTTFYLATSTVQWLHCKRHGCSHSCYHQLRHLLKLSLFRFCDILKYGTVLRHICSYTICSFNFAQPTLRVLLYKTCSIHFSRLRYMHSHVNAYSIHFSYPSLCVFILNTYNSFLLTSITCIRR